ncbi:MAG: hypothetical protein ACYDAO_05325 [Thermoplasmataceae archaeon]
MAKSENLTGFMLIIFGIVAIISILIPWWAIVSKSTDFSVLSSYKLFPFYVIKTFIVGGSMTTKTYYGSNSFSDYSVLFGAGIFAILGGGISFISGLFHISSSSGGIKGAGKSMALGAGIISLISALLYILFIYINKSNMEKSFSINTVWFGSSANFVSNSSWGLSYGFFMILISGIVMLILSAMSSK